MFKAINKGFPKYYIYSGAMKSLASNTSRINKFDRHASILFAVEEWSVFF
jgi:hypothetical protein